MKKAVLAVHQVVKGVDTVTRIQEELTQNGTEITSTTRYQHLKGHR
jgi:hypothetical protein